MPNDPTDPQDHDLMAPDGLVDEPSAHERELQRAADAGALDAEEVPGEGLPTDRIPAAGTTGQTGHTDARLDQAEHLDAERSDAFDADREVIDDNLDAGVEHEGARDRHGDPELADADPRDPRSSLDFAAASGSIPGPRDDDREPLAGDPVLGEPDTDRLDEHDRDATDGGGLDDRAGDPAVHDDRHDWRDRDTAEDAAYDGTDAAAHDRSDAPVNEAAAEQADVAAGAEPVQRGRTHDDEEAHG